MAVSPPIWDNLPAACRILPNWVLWKPLEREGRITKVPLDRYGNLASSTAPHSWCHLDEARKAHEGGIGQGVGFIFTRKVGISGVDLDHCRDPSTGEIDTWAQTIIAQLGSYAEISPSGAGVHILLKGSLPEGTDGKKKLLKGDGYRPDAAAEIYSAGRYFTMTGQHLPNSPSTVEDCQDALTALFTEIFGPAKDNTKNEEKGQEKAQDGPRVDQGGPSAPDKKAIKEIIKRMMHGTKAAEILKLYKGDTSAYGGDDSAADLALCNHLAFYCNKNARLMDALFRGSKLIRDKWDEDRGGQTYGEMTIAKAIEDTNQTWGGSHGEKGVNSSPPPSDNVAPQITAQASDKINAGEFVNMWSTVFSRRHNGDSHIPIAMAAANLSANIINSQGIAVLQVAGQSGDGKSHAVQTAAQQMGRWCDISGLSPMALLYHAGITVHGGMMVVLDDNRPDDRQADIIKRAQTQFKTGYRYKSVLKGEPVVLQMPPGVQLLTTEVDADSEDQVLNRTLFLEVEGNLDKDLKIIEADLRSLETGERPLDDPDITLCQVAFDMLKAKTYVVTIPDAEKKIKWQERSKDQRANLRNFNIFRDLILAYAVMRWPQRPHREEAGVTHVEATRQDFMDALALYHIIHRQMKTKLTNKEIEVLNFIKSKGGRVSREDAMKGLNLSKVRLSQLTRGAKGQGGLLAKVPGFYIEDATESLTQVAVEAGYYDPKIRKQYLCLSDTTIYQNELSSPTSFMAASWTDD